MKMTFLQFYIPFLHFFHSRYKFRANPINQSIFQNPNQGVHKVPSKEPTVPIEFDLSTDNRPQERVRQDEEEKYEFHAQPVPKNILKGVMVSIIYMYLIAPPGLDYLLCEPIYGSL
jgi:hypothetical protein